MHDADSRLAYSIESAAAALDVSPRYVQLLIQRGELASIKLGKLRRIPAAELIRFLDRAAA